MMCLSQRPVEAATDTPVLHGRVHLRRTPRPARDRYYLYIPQRPLAGRVVVAVHGIGRGAREQATLLAPMAESRGAILIAPLFDADRFPDFQRLGRAGKGERADLALERIVSDAEESLGTPLGPLSLFGFSGGGQFAHRYALAHPARIAKMVVAASGWFTAPDADEPYPYGTAPCRALPDLRFDLDGFLRIPMLVVASRKDRQRDANLRRGRKLDAAQGRNRLERARQWVTHVRREAKSRGIDNRCRFRSLRRSGHDFGDAVRRDGLDELIFDFFWDPMVPEHTRRVER